MLPIKFTEDEQISGQPHKLSTVVSWSIIPHLSAESKPEGEWARLEAAFLIEAINKWLEGLNAAYCDLDTSKLRIILLPVVSPARSYYLEVENVPKQNSLVKPLPFDKVEEYKNLK